MTKPSNDNLGSNVTMLENSASGLSGDFNWKELKFNDIRQNGDFRRAYFSYRSIELAAQKILEARTDAGLTQAQLAKLAGLAQPQLSKLERAAEQLYTRSDPPQLVVPDSGRIEGPTIGLIGRVLAAAGFKIKEIVLEPCESSK